MSDPINNNRPSGGGEQDDRVSKAAGSIDAIKFDTPNNVDQASVVHSSGVPNSSRRELLVQEGSPWWHSQFNLMLSVFALLVLAAGLFILISPAPSSRPLNTTLVSASGQTSTQETSSPNDQQELAPWDESRNKQARADSQDILAELLKAKKELEAQNVNEWGAQGYQGALDKAAEGDELYKLKDFQNAIAAYQQALDDMQGLDLLIPEVLRDLVSQGNAAIAQGKTELAREKFQAAIALDRNNIAALQGINRSETLDQVLAIVNQAAQDEVEFQNTDDIEFLDLAADKYAKALVLDSKTETAELGSQRVAQLKSDKQFRDAMSAGFKALFARQFTSAKRGFSAALKIKPNDQTASSAYRQALASDKRSSLSSMLANAKKLETGEEWSSALSTYQAVLQRDPNQVSAKIGKVRAEVRKRLDISIKNVLSDPLSLARSSQRKTAETVLADAKGIKRKGPVLNAQIANIEAALKQLDSTINVSFESDSLTEVSLSKAGSKRLRLGAFSVKNLALKPGRYTLKGVRLGFKDELREIELTATGESIQTFIIACTTPVSGSPLATN